MNGRREITAIVDQPRKIGKRKTFATAIMSTRKIMLEPEAYIFLLRETSVFFPFKMKYAPIMVENSARHFMNPLKGSRNEIMAKDTKVVVAPGMKPKDRNATNMGIPTTSNFKKGARGKGILKNLEISRTATTAPKIAVLAKITLFLST